MKRRRHRNRRSVLEGFNAMSPRRKAQPKQPPANSQKARVPLSPEHQQSFVQSLNLQQKVIELIRKLRDQGVPVILITHTLPDVFAVCDRIVVMHRGRKVADKPIGETDTGQLVHYMVGALDDFAPA